jgi:hypothetical protein
VDLDDNLKERFAHSTVITQIRRTPSEWAIENAKPGSESAVPYLHFLDAAFQDPETGIRGTD